MKKVLIITQKLDPHTDIIINEIEKLGGEVLRLNTESLLDFYDISLSVNGNLFSGNITDKFNRSIDFTNLTSAYFRRPANVEPHIELQIDGVKKFSTIEGELFLDFIYAFPNIKWVNNPFNNKKAQVKFEQLCRASNIGLTIPPTLITNNPNTAKSFFIEQDYNVLCKSLDTNTVHVNARDVHIFSHKLTKKELENNLESIKYAPTLLQSYIEKKKEIRVNIIGNKVFATEIDSQISTEASVDWRQVEPWSLPHKPIELPISLKNKLLKFVRSYNLYYSAIDLIQTTDNNYVFLENNPNGQWYWIELLTKQPLANSIAQLLLT